MSEKRQKNQLQLAFMMEGRDESPSTIVGGTETLMAEGKAESPAEADRLMEEILDPEWAVVSITHRTAVYGPVRTVV